MIKYADVRIFLCTTPTSMNYSFDRLMTRAHETFDQDPTSGHDLDVGLYIKDVLDQLLAGCTDYQSLLPDPWKQRHPEAIRQYRQEERRDKTERKQYTAAKRRVA